jgi:hypothetical protein
MHIKRWSLPGHSLLNYLTLDATLAKGGTELEQRLVRIVARMLCLDDLCRENKGATLHAIPEQTNHVTVHFNTHRPASSQRQG